MDLAQSFVTALNAVVPFIIYIVFGYIVVRVHFIKEESLYKTNTIVFKCFFPILMFNNFFSMDLSIGFDFKTIGFVILLSLVFVAIYLFTVHRLVKENPRRGVIVQGLLRTNTLLFAIPFTETLYGAGSETAMLASVLVALLVPLNNVLSVTILEYYRGGKPSVKQLLIQLISNPLITGAILGGIALIFKINFGFTMPECIQKPITAFSNLTTPISLFILGGTLHFSGIIKNRKTLTWTLLFKLFLIPLVVCLLIWPLPFSESERFVIFIMFATPAAVASYTTACNMGGDGELAGEIVAVSTVISLFSLFLWILALRGIGFI